MSARRKKPEMFGDLQITIHHVEATPPAVTLADIHDVGETPVHAVVGSLQGQRRGKRWASLVFRGPGRAYITTTHPFEDRS